MSKQNFLEIMVPIRLDTKWYQGLVKELSVVKSFVEWQREGTIHQTLVFIKDESLVSKLKREFRTIRTKIKPITLTIDTLEAFTTGKGDKHVVSLTSSQPPSGLLELANDARVCAECLGANYDKRPFKLHITLCKIPSDAIALEDLQSILAKISLPAFDCRLDDVQYRYQGSEKLIDKWNLEISI